MIPVHLITGALGVGKTTVLQNLLRHFSNERVAVIVNDFGEARVDGALLSDFGVDITEIAGVCVCCTAPERLQESLDEILHRVQPSRIFIEPTGLAAPADLVDSIRRSAMQGQLRIAPVVVVVDPLRIDDSEVKASLAVADVIVINKLDRSSEAIQQHCQAMIADLWPGPQCIVYTQFGMVEPEILTGESQVRTHAHLHGATRCWKSKSQNWPPEIIFRWEELLKSMEASIGRIKGIFRTDRGWYRCDRTNGEVIVHPSGWRTDSRMDIMDTDEFRISTAFESFQLAIGNIHTIDGAIECVLSQQHIILDREWLAQGEIIPDIQVIFPNRRGMAVPMQSILERLGVIDGEVVIVAGDGFVSAPIPALILASGYLVFEGNGAPLPTEQGGPFRLFLPADAATTCTNVKNVVRMVVKNDR